MRLEEPDRSPRNYRRNQVAFLVEETQLKTVVAKHRSQQMGKVVDCHPVQLEHQLLLGNLTKVIGVEGPQPPRLAPVQNHHDQNSLKLSTGSA